MHIMIMDKNMDTSTTMSSINVKKRYYDTISTSCNPEGKRGNISNIVLVDVNANDHNANVMSFASKLSRYDNNFCLVISFRFR